MHPKEIDLTLDRVFKVAMRLQVIEFACPVIVVAGTNGKGSTIALLSSILNAAGYKVGCYTSPHLNVFNERIVMDQKPIADEPLIQAFEEVEKARGQQSLTYFEFTTLAAFLCFKKSHLDVLLLEIGLGGRLDAVNIVKRDLAIITTLAKDHMVWQSTGK